MIVLDWSDDKSLSVAKVLKWRAPGALLNSLAASAKLLAASLSPTALVITACFSLSASAILAIVLCISAGNLTSFNSTFSTLIPHGSEAWSITSQISVEILSLWVNNSSSVTAPTALRIVVCANWETAYL